MKILFVHQGMVTFVERDFKILGEAHVVRECFFPGHRKGGLRVIRDAINLFGGILWCDISFSWFGKLHAFFAVLFTKLLGKKSVVVAGGDDVAGEAETHTSIFSVWWKRWCPLFVFKHADLILCVSEFNRSETIRNAKADPRKIRLVYHGFELDKYRRIADAGKESLALSVGYVKLGNLSEKGHRVFVESARFLPRTQFILVGPWVDEAAQQLRMLGSQNVAFTGGLYGDDLVRMYNRATVYVQASGYESFGCSVAEAMLCGCVPVVSRRAALPEVVGDCGLYVDALDAEELAERIKEALDSDLGCRARERIAELFPIERRRSELLAAVDEVGGRKRRAH